MASDKPRRIEPATLGFIAIGVMLLGLLVAMGGKLMDSKIVVFAGTFVMIATALLGLFGAHLLSVRARQRRKRTNIAKKATEPELLPRADTTNKLLPIANTDDFIPTVTEATTDLLKTPVSNQSDIHS